MTAGGVPVSGASVEVLPLAAGAQEQSLTAVTDANGDFVVQGLTPDQYSVAVESAGFAAWQQSLTVAGNLTQSVVLLAGGVVQGTITDASTGLPVAGANVSFLDPATHSIAASAATNASGQYQAANVLPGTYDVLIEEPSHQMTELTGVVVSGSSCTVNGTLAAKSTLLQGTVTDSTGHPMVEATVTVVNSRGETMFVATTAIDGTWSTDELPPGNYTATASAIGYQTASVAVSLAAGSSRAVSLTVAAAATDDAWASNTVAGFLGYVSQLWYSSNNLYLTNPSDPTPKMIGLQNQMPPQPVGTAAWPAWSAAYRAHDNLVNAYERWEQNDMAYKTTVGSCSLEVITRLLALLNDAVGIACALYVAEWTAPSQWAELSADAVLGLKFAASAANLLTATVNAIEKGASFSQQLKNLAGSLLSTIAGFAKLAQLQQALANAGSSNPLLRGFSYVGAAADFLGLISSLLEQYKQYNNVSNIVIDARLNYLAAGAAYYTALQKLAIANAHCPPGTLVPAPSPPLPVPTQTVTFAPPPGAPGDNVYAYLVAGPGYQYPSGLPVGMVPPPAGYVGWWNTYSTGTTTYASTPYYVGYYSWQVLNPSVGPRILNPGSLLTVSCDFEPNWNQGWYDYNENAGTVAICGVPGITLVSGNTISNPGLDSWYYNDAITGNIPSGNLHVDLPLGPSTLVFQIPANAQSGLADVEIIGPYPGGQWSFVEGVYYFQIIAPNATTTALRITRFPSVRTTGHACRPGEHSKPLRPHARDRRLLRPDHQSGLGKGGHQQRGRRATDRVELQRRHPGDHGNLLRR